MRKASKIFFLVGAIVSIVAGVICLIAGLVLVILPNTEAFMEAMIREKVIQDDIEVVRLAMILYGTMCLIGVPFCGVNSFFGFKAFREEKPCTALNVLNIIFGVLTVYVNMVGGIFALIANGQEERRAAAGEKKE